MNITKSAVFSLLVLATCLSAPTNAKDTIYPKADIHANPLKIKSSDQVAFSARGSHGDGQLFYTWDFGDGNTQAGFEEVQHAYATAGFYVAVLTVTDSNGFQDVKSIEIEVKENTPPIAIAGLGNSFFAYEVSLTGQGQSSSSNSGNLSGDITGRTGDGTNLRVSLQNESANSSSTEVDLSGRARPLSGIITLDGRASYDPDGDQITYYWTASSGDVEIHPVDSPVPILRVLAPGPATITLTVSDATESAATEISIVLPDFDTSGGGGGSGGGGDPGDGGGGGGNDDGGGGGGGVFD